MGEAVAPLPLCPPAIAARDDRSMSPGASVIPSTKRRGSFHVTLAFVAR